MMVLLLSNSDSTAHALVRWVSSGGIARRPVPRAPTDCHVQPIVHVSLEIPSRVGTRTGIAIARQVGKARTVIRYGSRLYH